MPSLLFPQYKICQVDLNRKPDPISETKFFFFRCLWSLFIWAIISDLNPYFTSDRCISCIFCFVCFESNIFPANSYLFKVNNRNTRKKCKGCSNLTIKTPERRHHWFHSSIFVVNFDHSLYTFFYCFYCWLWTSKC